MPIIHISSKHLSTTPDIDDSAATELIHSDSDSDMDMSEFVNELQEVADSVHKLQQQRASAAVLSRRPLGAYYPSSDFFFFFIYM